MKWGLDSNTLPECNRGGKGCRWGNITRCRDKKRNDARRRERGRRQMRKRSEGERDGKEKQRE